MTSVLKLEPVKSWVARVQRASHSRAPSAAVRAEECAAASVLHIQGRLTIEQVAVFNNYIEEAIRHDVPRLVVDLSACPFIDSAGIAALVTAHGRARNANRELILVGLAPQVVSALTMARLLNAFSVCATMELALSGLTAARESIVKDEKSEARNLRDSLAMALATLVCLAAPAHAQPDSPGLLPDPAQSMWRMRYPNGDRVMVTLGPDSLLLETEGEARVVIPVAAITRLTYRPVSWRRSREIKETMLKTTFLLGDPECDPRACLFLVGVALTTELASMPFAHAIKTTQHFLIIRWQEENFEQEVTLRVHKRDIESALAELARRTGLEPENPIEAFQAQRRREEQGWREELRNARYDLAAVELDRRVWVGADELKPGLYYFAVLERGFHQRVLYFFRQPNLKPSAIVAEVEVEAVPVEEADAVGAVFGEQRGEAYLREIRLADRILRVKQALDRQSPSAQSAPEVEYSLALKEN